MTREMGRAVSPSSAPGRGAQSRLAEEIASIIRGTASLVGEAFTRELVRHLSHTLQVRYALISERLTGEPAMARTVAFWDGNKCTSGLVCEVAGKPSEKVFQGNVGYYPSGLHDLFPDYPEITNFGVTSYVGVPCFGLGGAVVGLIAVMDVNPISDSLSVETVLRMLSARVAGEIERRQTETALRASEERFRLLAEHVPDVIFRVRAGPAPIVDYVSPAIRQLTGYSPEEFTTDSGLALRVVHPADRSSLVVATRTGAEHHLTFRLIKRGGEVRWVEYRGTTTKDEGGDSLLIEGIVRDVSEREQLQVELREMEERYRELVTVLPDLVFRITKDGTYVDFFPADEIQPLVPPEQFLGKSMYDVLPEPVAQQSLHAIREALASKTMQRIEYDLELEGGTQTFEARIIPGGDDCVTAIVRDFTAQRRALPQLRLVESTAIPNERGAVFGNVYHLTARELAVLQRVASGAADKEIAEDLGISAYTVNKHVANILQKMKASSRTEAGVRALREGLLA